MTNLNNTYVYVHKSSRVYNLDKPLFLCAFSWQTQSTLCVAAAENINSG